jgi:hypothetical protein
MKKSFALATLMLSMTSIAATEFNAKMLNVDCKITSTEVTRTYTVGKENKASFTEKKEISMKGIDALAKIAAASTSGRPSTDTEYVYNMTYEGKTYLLSLDDSKESTTLMNIVSRLCR